MAGVRARRSGHVTDAGERVFDRRTKQWVLLCRVFVGPGECHRCGLLAAAAFCALCRDEMGEPTCDRAHAALIA